MDDRGLEDLVGFGAETQRFLLSDIGKYLLQRSQEEIDAAVEGLKSISPDDTSGIRKLQNEVSRNESVEVWLGEIIQAGADACAQLELLDQDG